jgi:phage shock protein PspC (stress-responsive transcriptional regulator)
MSSTTPGPNQPNGASAPSGPTGLDLFFAQLRRLGVARATHGKMAGGVCAGLARRWGVDPIVVRAVVVVLMAFGGLGLLAYLVALALLPDENGRIFTEEALRRGDGSAIFLLVVIGLMLAGEVSDRWWVWATIPLALGAWWVVRGIAAGKTPRQLGSEAKERAADAASTVRSWSTTSVPSTPPPPAPQPPSSPWATLPQDGPVGAAPVPPPAPPSAASLPPMASPAGPHGMGPGRTWAPAPQGAAPVVTPAKRRSGGFPLFVTAVGLGVATYGMLASLAGLANSVDQPSVFAAVAGCAVAALVVFLAALRGVRAPVTTFVVTIALIMNAIAALVPARTNLLAGAGERTWKPVATTSADTAYALGLGQATLDLSGMTSAADAYPIKVSLGLGELVIVVPDGVTAQVDLSLGGGEVTTERSTVDRTPTEVNSGGGVKQSYLFGSGPPDVVVTASVGAGSVVLRSSGAPVIMGGAS